MTFFEISFLQSFTNYQSRIKINGMWNSLSERQVSKLTDISIDSTMVLQVLTRFFFQAKTNTTTINHWAEAWKKRQ
jgi:hypothetical protein